MKKEEFKQKTYAVLEELSDYIAKLEDKAGEIAEDAKEEYREQLEKLKGVKENLSSKLDEFENVSDSKWDVVRESAASFLATVSDAWKENYGKVADALKKDKQTDAFGNTAEPDNKDDNKQKEQ